MPKIMWSTMNIRIACCGLLAVPLAAQGSGAWVTPAFKTGPPSSGDKIVSEQYNYTQSEYSPPILVEALKRNQRAGDTPEHAFISRISAMMDQDYDDWLTTWDSASRLWTIDSGTKMGRDKEFYIKQWSGTFAKTRMQLVRRITTGSYVLITYRLVNFAGEPVSPLEIPAILHRVDDR